MILNHAYAARQTVYRKSPLVLVVDDNQDNLIFADGALALLNYQCLTALDSKTALDIAVDRLPDLILLDIVMPKMSGLTVSQLLKQNPLTNHIPIIAVTGLAFPGQKQQIMNSSCDDYLCKPYLIEELEAKLLKYV